MSTTTSQSSTRVSYNNGILLDASDFQQEQSYNRSQLARALARIHGFGTVAGLKVERFAAGTLRTEDNQPRAEEELVVNPGLAIDRCGRLIEIKSKQCLRLNRWLQYQIAQPAAALNPHRTATDERYYVGDLFVRFVECPQGLRPGFPEPAADATDALVASRTLEGFELMLVPRDCDPETSLPATPVSRFPTTPATKRAALDALYAAYSQTTPAIDQEYPLDFKDKTAVWLSRVRIRLLDAPDTTLDRHASTDVVIDDLARPIIPPSDLVLRLLPA